MVFTDVKPQCWSNGGNIVDTNIRVPNIREFVNHDSSFFAIGNPYISSDNGTDIYLLQYDSDHSMWDTAYRFKRILSSAVTYNGNLVVSGQPGFVGFGNLSQIGAVSFQNDTINSLMNVDASVLKMRVIDNELYASGWFREVNGDTNIKYLAKYDGNTWRPVHDVEVGNGSIDDFIYYEDELYIAGNFKIEGTDIIDIAVYRNGSWQKVGEGLTGPLTGVATLEVYKGELYAGGLIIKSSGNPGHGLIKWDGTSWSEPGYGLRGFSGDTTSVIKVHEIKVHDDYLYAVGEFFSFGGENSTPLKSVARWDGESWCSFQGSNDVFYGQAGSIGFYQDTMFIYGGSDSINGEANNRFLKCGDFDNYIADCVTDSSSVGLDLVPGEVNVSVFPNPAKEFINVKLANTKDREIKGFYITDTKGRVVKKVTQTVPGISNLHIDVSGLSKGTYFISLTSDEGVDMTEKFIKL